jgi:hypothetical protein
LIQCIRNHHQPDGGAPHGELAASVFLADLLMSRFNSGLEIECHDTRRLTRQLTTLGLNEGRFVELVDLIPGAALKPAETAEASLETP